jgi:6-phosphogluconolactonase
MGIAVRIQLIFLLLALSTLTGCMPTQGNVRKKMPMQSDDAFHIFAPSRSSQSVLVATARRSDGELSLKMAQRIELGFSVMSITRHPDRPLLYVAAAWGDEGDTLGAVIHLNSDGSYRTHNKVVLLHGYAYMSVDRAGEYLLGANYRDGFVDTYRIHDDGTLSAPVTTLNEGRKNAHCVLASPDNRFLYIPYVKDTNAIFQYEFKGGSLKALVPKNANPPAGTGPRHIAYHPSKPLVYFSNEQHIGVSVYEMLPDGQLKMVQVCDALAGDQDKQGLSASDIAITPDARFIFAGLRDHKQAFDRISRYRIKSDGQLELLGLTPADRIPWGLTLSPQGGYLLVSAFKGATLTAYSIGDDGNLKRAANLTWDKQISDLEVVGSKN